MENIKGDKKLEIKERDVKAISSSNPPISTLIGSISQDVLDEKKKKNISSDEISLNLYHELIRNRDSKEICWGKLIGSEVVGSNVVVDILWNGLIVKIKDDDFFEDTYRFGKLYYEMDEKGKLKRRESTIHFMFNSNICFTVTSVERIIQEDKYDEKMYGKEIVSIVGNRKEAMSILRDIYFFHKNRKTLVGKARELNTNDIVQGNIIQVKEESILVECAGIETRIAAGLLSPNSKIDNCMEKFSPGDIETFRIKKLYVNPDKEEVHLSLSGRILDPDRVISNIKVGSSYLGTVDSHNMEKGLSTVLLYMGASCVVYDSDVTGHLILIPGDKVRVTVRKIMGSFASGVATKI